MGQNTAAIIGGAASVGASVAIMIGAKKQRDQAIEDKGIADGVLTDLENSRQDLSNPYENMSNQFENLSVANKAAQMQAEEADISLANTLDNLRATGAGSGGATALAMAALKSKQGVSATLEKQEAANEQLRARGAQALQKQKAEGQKWEWEKQEEREMIQLDRAQAEIDNEQAQANASNAAMYGAIGNIGSALMSTGFNISGGGGNTNTTNTTNPSTTGGGTPGTVYNTSGVLQGSGNPQPSSWTMPNWTGIPGQ